VLRDEGERYAKRLAEAGVPTKVTRYDGMHHGFFQMCRHPDQAKKALEEAAAWLKLSYWPSSIALPTALVELVCFDSLTHSSRDPCHVLTSLTGHLTPHPRCRQGTAVASPVVSVGYVLMWPAVCLIYAKLRLARQDAGRGES